MWIGATKQAPREVGSHPTPTRTEVHVSTLLGTAVMSRHATRDVTPQDGDESFRSKRKGTEVAETQPTRMDLEMGQKVHSQSMWTLRWHSENTEQGRQ